MTVICSNYKFAIKEIFTNGACIGLYFGAMFRLFNTSGVSIYTPVYMKIYGKYYTTYTSIDAVSTFVAGIVTNIISAAIMERFIDNPMTKAYLCCFKAGIDIPCVAMIFL